ncbi:P-loop containing nucleoside triphosphate hydrolase protein [Roridomyces roridus]|uniref:P-loop containing nucleoside triphosphate hydrolase protein n=1 Tax=Roridomyces roridus TaxID=1738132 RepID=A0AAD7FTL1_9AGAR|nr:P-loop containing nucleoside triphosphate hydrolase protein [Roridomyces roridus]
MFSSATSAMHHLFCSGTSFSDLFYVQCDSCTPEKAHTLEEESKHTVYDAWLASRTLPNGETLVSGAQRRLSLYNAQLAFLIIRTSAVEFFAHILSLHPSRTVLMMSLNIIRSIFPAFRGYSQALIINELQSLITSGNFTWSRLLNLVASELIRRVFESLLDSLAASNETVVLDSAKFYVEYVQMEQRVRLDIPTLSDPVVRDLLNESDLFVRSFSGSGFGLLSPLDLIQILSLATEIFSHLVLILSLTGGPTHYGILLLSVLSVILPASLARFGCPPEHAESLYTPREVRAAERQEKMRGLAYDEQWILKTWATARRTVLDSEQSHHLRDSAFMSKLNFSDFLFAIQNLPLLMLLQTSSASLGSLTLYRSSIQSVILASRSLLATSHMLFQGIFFMSAFCASKQLKAKLQPEVDDMQCYRSPERGATISARSISYSYPGCSGPTLKDVNFTLGSECLAIVGQNGSGKSTLAKILLRILDHDRGELYVNGVDIRRYDPAEYHRHLTAVFQDFSKFDATMRENVGFGLVEKMRSRSAVESAIRFGAADKVVEALPKGLQTTLSSGESMSYPGCPSSRQHGLSGGEWQRVSLARAFMRATDPQIDLLLFDEATSSLDAQAQAQIFDTVERITRSPVTGQRTKTVIFVTHNLSVARRADKVAMMENGTVAEFGTHAELVEKGGSYAALYRASLGGE